MELRIDRFEPCRNLSNGKLLAYTSMVIDGSILVEDMRVVRPAPDKLMVAFPSRTLHVNCSTCRYNRCRQRDNYCCKCGSSLSVPEDVKYVEMVHPITPECRRRITGMFLKRVEEEGL